MTTALRLVTSVTLFAFTLPTVGADHSSIKPAASILILDDLSGIELKDKHGITETSAEDLKVLRDAVLSSRQCVHLFHDIVDEDGTDNQPLSLAFRPFAEAPPIVPVLRGTMAAMQKEKLDFDTKRAAFLRRLSSYASTMQADIESFMLGIANQQMATAARFDKFRSDNNGKDYNHSDISNAILADAKALTSATGLRVLVLNTDMEDLPYKGASRSKPFTVEELPADTVIVFVNTSRKPDASPLFRGTPNTKHHADSMRAALELISTWLVQPDLAKQSATVTQTSR